MSAKILVQVKVCKKLNKEFNTAAQKIGLAKWKAMERGMQLYIEECELPKVAGKK
ncbi:hypothetical protein KAR91_59090 [Candidatus Pacearchaeota archaeon]|nr:hypothetical protein [Candidatus Pacearchaeota archaeon]